jgi:hypothetical protein
MPVLVHSMKLVADPTSTSTNFVKQMSLDLSRNILFCRMAVGTIFIIQLFKPPNERQSLIIERINSY